MARSSTSWQPGHSGNPAGRPQELALVKEFARGQSLEAITYLADVMRDSALPHRLRVKAAAIILDRAQDQAVLAE